MQANTLDLWHELALGAMEGPTVCCFLHLRTSSGSLRDSASLARVEGGMEVEVPNKGRGSQYVNCLPREPQCSQICRLSTSGI